MSQEIAALLTLLMIAELIASGWFAFWTGRKILSWQTDGCIKVPLAIIVSPAVFFLAFVGFLVVNALIGIPLQLSGSFFEFLR